MTIVNITPATDLAALVGVPVRIVRTSCGVHGVFHGVFESLWHQPKFGDAGGMLLEERHDGCLGGMTGLSLPYGTCTVTVLDGQVP